jgi:hypothetical protein
MANSLMKDEQLCEILEEYDYDVICGVIVWMIQNCQLWLHTIKPSWT